MAREKKGPGPGATSGTHAKDRHKRDKREKRRDRRERDRRGNLIDWKGPLPEGLVAHLDRPKISSKHKTWFEFMENKNKKKKLEIEFTEKQEPPPGFEFVPAGNPVLTTKCKELSRERGAMIFVVTSVNSTISRELSWHLNRVGHHIRQSIVEEAREALGDDVLLNIGPNSGLPEPIPESQEEIYKQADAAIRDLFPRIPNPDRADVLDQSFNKAKQDASPVGLANDITLTRRVQLAVLAHIRHKHTRYDQLLKETSWVNARKAVESLCLDFIVKWRGDEETGRDQLDEILCEVIVISDSESEDSTDDDEDSDDDESSDSSVAEEGPRGGEAGEFSPTRAQPLLAAQYNGPLTAATNLPRGDDLHRATHAPQKVKKAPRVDRKAAKWAQRGFSRYSQAWNQALERQRSFVDTEVVRLSHPELDLSDHLLQSIEPRSPVRNPVHHRQQEAPYEDSTNHVRTVSFRPAPPPARAAGVQDYSTLRGDEGFIRLPPRTTPSRTSVAPPELRTSNFPVGQPSYSSTRAYAPEPAYRDVVRRPTYYEDVATGDYRPLPKPMSRPIWVDEQGRVLRRESHPIVIESSPERQQRAGPAYSSSGNHHTLPALREEPHPIYVENVPERQRVGPAYTSSGNQHTLSVLRSDTRPILISDSPDRQPRISPAYSSSGYYPQPSGAAEERPYTNNRSNQSLDRPGDGFVEIISVSNRFPRRHEASPVPVDTGAYNMRPEASQSRYHVRQPSVHPQPQRIERVVGVEYLPIRHSYETRTYIERGPLEEAAPIYRSRTTSDAPAPYPGHENRFYRNHADPRRDEIITIE